MAAFFPGVCYKHFPIHHLLSDPRLCELLLLPVTTKFVTIIKEWITGRYVTWATCHCWGFLHLKIVCVIQWRMTGTHTQVRLFCLFCFVLLFFLQKSYKSNAFVVHVEGKLSLVKSENIQIFFSFSFLSLLSLRGGGVIYYLFIYLMVSRFKLKLLIFSYWQPNKRIHSP